MEEESKVVKLLEGPLKEKGYTLFEVKYKPHHKDGPKLEITVDRDEPISLNDIVNLSQFLSPLLDEGDPISGPYTLDVSSLGAEKPLKPETLGERVGSYVNIHLINAIKGTNTLEGEITSSDEGKITILLIEKGRKKEIEVDLTNVDRARLAIKF